MGLDLRIPLGLMFLAIGGLLEAYGLGTWHSAIYARSLGENLNIIWGGVLLLFGALMYGLGRRARWQDDPMNPRPWEEPGTEPAKRHGH